MTEKTPNTAGPSGDTVSQTNLTREFRWNGLVLPDPSPKAKPADVRDIFAGTYPELATAAVKGPTFEGDKMIFSFQAAAGAKG